MAHGQHGLADSHLGLMSDSAGQGAKLAVLSESFPSPPEGAGCFVVSLALGLLIYAPRSIRASSLPKCIWRVMAIQRINSGRRLSQATVHNGTVYLAGQVAEDAKGMSVKEQTVLILKQIDALLASAKTDKSKLLSAMIWLANISYYDEVNSVWDAWVAPGCAPARACVEAKLAGPEYALEIAVIAAV